MLKKKSNERLGQLALTSRRAFLRSGGVCLWAVTLAEQHVQRGSEDEERGRSGLAAPEPRLLHTGRSTAYWQGLRLDTGFCTAG